MWHWYFNLNTEERKGGMQNKQYIQNKKKYEQKRRKKKEINGTTETTHYNNLYFFKLYNIFTSARLASDVLWMTKVTVSLLLLLMMVMYVSFFVWSLTDKKKMKKRCHRDNQRRTLPLAHPSCFLQIPHELETPL